MLTFRKADKTATFVNLKRPLYAQVRNEGTEPEAVFFHVRMRPGNWKILSGLTLKISTDVAEPAPGRKPAKRPYQDGIILPANIDEIWVRSQGTGCSAMKIPRSNRS